MEYYIIYKTDEVKKSTKPLSFKDGYSFTKKMVITLYESGLIKHVLTTKINNSLKSIINLYLMIEEDEDGESEASRETLLPKIELMRRMLLEKYAMFLGIDEVESYLNKLEKLEKKIGKKQYKKTRSL